MTLDERDFLEVIERTPLVSIDLVVQDQAGRVLLGWRTREPAKNTWFVPGGRIRKNETLDAAFSRIAAAELGTSLARSQAALLGVYTHLYETNFAGAAGIDTHYVVLAYALSAAEAPQSLPKEQHSAYCWLSAGEAFRHPEVHPYVLPYFEALSGLAGNAA
ncbi:GDP-mannose mannosyl hydrolase [Candidatus Methylomicrobium oryzae]|jgi:colanic acid biosynthesis protein WcaH|uniref:GDP-mannose mannosyl hydrolase n=1 Tax=Candidatus Methylomicrobium oryzae TaxID=2802053 RepID=UPI0019216135|nr:GDP-mannose mannosyl hydrolase [Methylomicrobium sp. RS1]MBL1263148.1 GDP-mannose mannosyl hydrolase [Methylomicrobium sp. RS1]